MKRSLALVVPAVAATLTACNPKLPITPFNPSLHQNPAIVDVVRDPGTGNQLAKHFWVAIDGKVHNGICRDERVRYALDPGRHQFAGMACEGGVVLELASVLAKQRLPAGCDGGILELVLQPGDRRIVRIAGGLLSVTVTEVAGPLPEHAREVPPGTVSPGTFCSIL